MNLAFVDVNNSGATANINNLLAQSKVKKGILYILYGEASQYLYANRTAWLIQSGASAVAIAYGLDVTKDGGKARMLFTTPEWFKEEVDAFVFDYDKPLDENFPNESKDGKPVKNIIYIDCELYVRNDKNCIPCDKLS